MPLKTIEPQKVKIAKTRPDAAAPTRGSSESAGYDLYACMDAPVKIYPHCTEMIGTGLRIQPPEGYFGAIFARSGLAAKYGLRPANAVGVCDRDYTGEYIVALHNDSTDTWSVEPGERIAQLVFLPYLDLEFVETENIEDTERGGCGFGSTGE